MRRRTARAADDRAAQSKLYGRPDASDAGEFWQEGDPRLAERGFTARGTAGMRGQLRAGLWPRRCERCRTGRGHFITTSTGAAFPIRARTPRSTRRQVARRPAPSLVKRCSMARVPRSVTSSIIAGASAATIRTWSAMSIPRSATGTPARRFPRR